MLHPVKAATSFECDGCGHHASFHSLENPAEDTIVKKWAEEEEKQREEKQAAGGAGRKRKRIAAPEQAVEEREIIELEDNEESVTEQDDDPIQQSKGSRSATERRHMRWAKQTEARRVSIWDPDKEKIVNKQLKQQLQEMHDELDRLPRVRHAAQPIATEVAETVEVDSSDNESTEEEEVAPPSPDSLNNEDVVDAPKQLASTQAIEDEESDMGQIEFDGELHDRKAFLDTILKEILKAAFAPPEPLREGDQLRSSILQTDWATPKPERRPGEDWRESLMRAHERKCQAWAKLDVLLDHSWIYTPTRRLKQRYQFPGWEEVRDNPHLLGRYAAELSRAGMQPCGGADGVEGGCECRDDWRHRWMPKRTVVFPKPEEVEDEHEFMRVYYQRRPPAGIGGVNLAQQC